MIFSTGVNWGATATSTSIELTTFATDDGLDESAWEGAATRWRGDRRLFDEASEDGWRLHI